MSLKSLKFITNLVRSASTKPVTNNFINAYVYNRNPRNLEKMRIDRKPSGYPLEQVFIEYWHKLEIIPGKNFVTAQLVHNSDKVIITASTNEWAIYKHLYSKSDTLAYMTLAEVFAERCLESGIYSFACDIVPDEKNIKVKSFLEILQKEGLTLSEMPQFDIYKIWHTKREKRPWTVLEDENEEGHNIKV